MLNKLTTKRLLKYRDSLLSCHETPDNDSTFLNRKIVKSSDEWKEHYALVKSILNKREHVKKEKL